MKRLSLLVVVLLGTVAFGARPVSAHTGLDYSLPSDGSVVGEPLDEITVAFTEPVTLVGNGFQVLDPQGEVVLPTPITDDDIVFRLILDAPLAGGEVGVLYEVTSADGHVVSGGFSFVVDAPVPTTVPTTVPATVAPTTAAPDPTTAPSTTAAPSTSAAPSSTETIAPSTSVAETDDEGGGSAGLIIAGAVGVAIVAAGFVLFRGRTAG